MENWYIKNKEGNLNEIISNFKLNKLTAKLLINRGLQSKEQIDEYINPSIEKLIDPSQLIGVDAASAIIRDRISKDKKIRIVGDFDVDGVSSTYILYRTLIKLGADVDYTIPDRIDDGYGLNNRIVLEAKAQGIDTIITCDNGISAFEPLRIAREMGMTTIITDHHEVIYETINDEKRVKLPLADAIVNPKLPNSLYQNKSLCGAGVALKLSAKLFEKERDKHGWKEFLEICAIATICDVVDLVGENRTIVVNGLKALNNTTNVGLKALIKETGLEGKAINVYHIGFILGPCFNASGRLESAIYALELLLEEDPEIAMEMAKKLRSLNEERKKLTEEGVALVESAIEKESIDANILVIYEQTIHESIAGIVAGRIKEKYNKPTIVLTKGKDSVKGSARSIESYDIFKGLNTAKDLLLKFGGHPMAAGMTLMENNIDMLRLRLNKTSELTEKDLIKKIYIDSPFNLENVDFLICEELNLLEPFGKGNPKPLLAQKAVLIKNGFILGQNNNVIKLNAISNGNQISDLIIFESADVFIENIDSKLGKKSTERLLKGALDNVYLDIVYYPQINEYLGNRKVQYIISNYRVSEESR